MKENIIPKHCQRGYWKQHRLALQRSMQRHIHPPVIPVKCTAWDPASNLGLALQARGLFIIFVLLMRWQRSLSEWNAHATQIGAPLFLFISTALINQLSNVQHALGYILPSQVSCHCCHTLCTVKYSWDSLQCWRYRTENRKQSPLPISRRNFLCDWHTGMWMQGTSADTVQFLIPAALRTCCSLNNAVGCPSLTYPPS